MEAQTINLLLADDDPNVRMLFKRLLTQAGYKIVCEAASGEEAVQKHAEHSPDLTLLDVSMPGISGIEALKRIREKQPQALVAMLTAASEACVFDEAIQAGAQKCIRKDLPLNEIRQSVEFLLKSRSK